MSDPFDLDNLNTPDTPYRAGDQTSMPAAYLEGLNSPQREAVEAIDGPLLVLAGAGTGKTRVLITRLAHILATGSGYPGEILAVTFTNKAALEIKERVGHIIGDAVHSLYWMGTFHAIGVKILRRHGSFVGLENNFTILDDDDQLRLLKQIVRGANIDEKKFPPRMLASVIDGWKNRGLLPNQVPKEEAHKYANDKAIIFYRDYQSRLKNLNAVDFGDLILLCLTLLQNNPAILSDYQRRFRYILVDEYQDTNVAQYLLLRLLAQSHKNICCVGDDDQSIYGWRGAEVGNILRFEHDFSDHPLGARIIRLEQNYRSTHHILGASGGLISLNESRLGKTLWTEKEGGEKVTVNPVWDGREEARNIGEMIEERQRKGQKISDMAILVRASSQTREFEERFLTLGLPHRIIGGFRFYERAEIRDMTAYLRHIHNPNDSLAFERIINVPKRGIGDSTVKKIHDISRSQQCSLSKAAEIILDTGDIKGKAKNNLRELLDNFNRWRDIGKDSDHIALTETIMEESGYRDMWRHDKSPDAEGKLENLSELIRALEPFENLEEFLEHIALVMENTQNNHQDKVSIMTLHGAKGLEFDTVFLPGWEEDLFPSKKSLEENSTKGLEEERRLAYVGLTRARKEAHIFHTSSRYLYGQYTNPIPSRFISELPNEHTEIKSSQTMYGQATPSGFSDTPPAWSQGYIRPHDQSHIASQLDRSRAKKNYTVPKISQKKELTSDFDIGDRIFHDKFGYGHIVNIDGNRLEINFDHGSCRKLMDSFVRSA
ncbi:MAG: UvrD-helicase domain-containing protein [Emcibacter sp.]|nr:UvrD-helicase domain-containing protein [Emcibacter sp.]